MAKNLRHHLKDSYSLLSKSQQKKGKKISIVIIINVILDLFSFVSVLPLLIMVFSQDNVDNNGIIDYLYNLTGFSSIESLIYLTISFVLLFFIAKSIFSYNVIKKSVNYTANISISLVNRMYRQTLLDSKYENSGEQVVNIVNIPHSFIGKTVSAFFDFVSKIVLILIVTISLAIYNIEVFSYLTIAVIPIAFAYVKVRSKHLKSIRSNLKKSQPELLQRALESLNGKIEIIMSGNRNSFFDEFVNANNTFNSTLAKLGLTVKSSSKFIELIALSGICVLFLYSTWVGHGKDEIFFILSVYGISAYKLIPSINGINVAYTNLKTHQYATEILESHLGGVSNEENHTLESKNKISFENTIEFKNVSFNYPNSTFELTNLNFAIKKNDRIAIIGESGSGKSTIVQLLLRMLIETKGEMYVDHLKISQNDTLELRKLISYVPQSVFLFEGSLLENVCMKNTELMQQRIAVEATLKSLGLTELISASNEGIESIVEDKGTNVSAGQKQRIGIARAILQDREIMVLDEITSNLDKENRKSLISILQGSHLDKTLIFATHEPEIIEMCNVVLEVKSGEVYLKS